VLLCAALTLGSIAVSNAAPTVLTASEVRAQRFTLLDPNGGVADDWYTDAASANGPNAAHKMLPGYSRWGFYGP
jgi:hypothetical protein